MDKIAAAIGWIFGGTLLLLGIGSFLWLLLDWAGFGFGYHHVGLSLWSYVLVFSLLSIYLGALVLRSTIKNRQNLQ